MKRIILMAAALFAAVVGFGQTPLENDPAVRESVCTACSFLGIDFNKEANNVRGKDTILTNPGSKVVVTTVTTNEELVIAQETMKLTTK